MDSDIYAGVKQIFDAVLRQHTETETQSPLQRINSLFQTADVLRGHVAACVVEEARRLNALLPIHRLPVEILTAIYTLVLKDIPMTRYYDDVHSLMTVCRLWEAVISDTPSIWSRISTEHPLWLIKKALVLSRSALLEIEFNIAHTNIIPLTIQPLLDDIGRLRSATIDAHEAILLKVAFGLSDLIEKLDMSSLGGPRPIVELNPDARFPRLHDLTLWHCNLRWDLPFFSNSSTTLHLAWVEGVTLQRLLSILGNSLQLRSLELHNISFSDTAYDGPTIVLKHLEVFRVACSEYSTSQIILECIHYSSSSVVFINVEPDDEIPAIIGDFFDQETTKNLLLHVQRLKSRCSSLNVDLTSLDDHEYVMQIQGDSSKTGTSIFDVAFYTISLDITLQCLRSIGLQDAGTPVVNLSITPEEDSNAAEVAFFAWCKLLPTTVRLSFDLFETSVAATVAIKMLGTYHAHTGSSEKFWILPNLRRLWFGYQSVPLDVIMAMLLARDGHAAPLETQGDLPAKIEELRLNENCNPLMLERLKRFMGPGNLKSPSAE